MLRSFIFSVSLTLLALWLNDFSLYPNQKKISTINTSPIWHAPSVIDNFQYKQTNLPVFKLYIQPDDFFSYENGIYIRGCRQFVNQKTSLTQKWWDWPGNYLIRGKKSYRPAICKYIYQSKEQQLDVNVRINGNKTRAFPQKSLFISSAKKNQRFVINFPDSTYTTKEILLRNSGNDWGKTLFADALCHQMMSGSLLDVQPYQHIVLYINDEYWGIHNLTLKINQKFLSKKYKCKKKNITIIEDGKLSDGNKNLIAEWNNFLAELQSDKISDDQKYELIQNTIDIDNFNVYIMFQVFFANTDWPHNNVKVYKLNENKWKFLPHDLDYSFTYTGIQAIQYNMFAHILNSQNTSINIIFKELLKNKNYKINFKKQFLDKLKTYFNEQKNIDYINEYETILSDEIQRHIFRWNKPLNYNNWHNNVANIKKFIIERNKFLQLHIIQL